MALKKVTILGSQISEESRGMALSSFSTKADVVSSMANSGSVISCSLGTSGGYGNIRTRLFDKNGVAVIDNSQNLSPAGAFIVLAVTDADVTSGTYTVQNAPYPVDVASRHAGAATLSPSAPDRFSTGYWHFEFSGKLDSYIVLRVNNTGESVGTTSDDINSIPLEGTLSGAGTFSLIVPFKVELV